LGIIGIEKHKGIIIFRPVRITHPLRRMRHKLQVEIPSDHTYSLFWAELSRLLGEKNPCCYSGAGTWDPGPAVQHFNHFATKQPQVDETWCFWL